MQPTVWDVDAALETLRSEDPKAAQSADSAVQWLTAGEGFDGVTQYDLQYFLWYTLPKKFLAPVEAQLEVADALGRLLELAGLPRYASISRSVTTQECINAWEKDEGLADYRRAQKSSGVEPPDTEELSWGTYFGLQENAALHGAAAALEMAILAGDLQPGASGWTKRQKQITRAWLTTSNAAFEGKTPLEAVHAERMEDWLRGRSDARRSVLETIAPRLVDHVGVPGDAEKSLEPLRWFLGAAEKEIPLTQKHNLGRAFVQEAAARYDWWDFFHRLTTELEVPYLHELHHFSRRLKLVRRKGRTLLLAPAGKRGLKDIETLWRTVAHGLFVGEDFEQAVAEVLFPLLIAEGEAHTHEIEARIAPILAEQGWSTRDEWGSSVPIDERGAARGMWDVTKIAVPLGMMAKGGDWRDRSLALTDFGVATGLEGLRARSVAPRRNVFA
ncbi:MAG: hypothetical protein H0U16_05195 [Actinobacteria bacterium]|nr:hypothetical protein [Actinomycetota bacterium]